jgi:hypothetical protein
VNQPARSIAPLFVERGFSNLKGVVMTKAKRAGNETVKPVQERPVIVCTAHKGVFYGRAADTSGDVVHLRGARMAIYFGTTRGVMELAETGPTAKSRISARADIEVRAITAVFEVTEAAAAKWESA